MRIINQKDFTTGLFFAVAGAGVVTGALEMQIGTPARMGPGFFPMLVGALLVLTGTIVAIGAMRRGVKAAGFGEWDLKTVAFIVCALLVFAAALEPLGLVIALPLLVFISGKAHRLSRLPALALLSAGLLVMVWLVFVKLLGQRLPLWPGLLD